MARRERCKAETHGRQNARTLAAAAHNAAATNQRARFGTIWHDFHLPSHQHVARQDGRMAGTQDDRS